MTYLPSCARHKGRQGLASRVQGFLRIYGQSPLRRLELRQSHKLRSKCCLMVYGYAVYERQTQLLGPGPAPSLQSHPWVGRGAKSQVASEQA